MNTEPIQRAAILIIDDDVASLRFLCDYLSSFGLHVLIQKEGESGLEMAQQNLPDLILLDVRMPGLDGYEICRALKAEQATQDIPVLFMSALTETFDKLKGFEAGGVDYITKPFQVEEIHMRINTHLSLRRLQKTLELQNAKLQQQISERQHTEQMLQQRNRELLLLNRATQLFSSSLELEQVLDTLLREVQQLLDVISISFWLTVPERQELICLQAKGPGSEELVNWRLPMGQGITGWVAAYGESAVVADTWNDYRYFQAVDHHTGVSVRSMISIPLRNKGSVIGVLNLVDPRVGRFCQDELIFAESLAAAAASAIENARLYEKSQREIAERKQAQQALAESEDRYRRLVEMSPEALLVHQRERYVYVNPAAQRLLAASSDEDLVGKSFWETLHKDYHDIVRERIHKMLTDSAPSELLEEKLIRLDGQVIDVEIIGTVISYQGEPAIQLVVRDISERKRTEELLRKLGKAVETTQVGITITDNEGRIVYVNPADAAMHGYRVEELIGQRSNIFASPRSHVQRIPLISPDQTGMLWERERINRRKDGTLFPVRLISNPIKDKYGQSIGRVIVCEDITERKRVENLLFKQTTLLRSVAKAMTCLLVTTDFQGAIAQVLSLLGFATEADRVYILKNVSEPKSGTLLVHRQFEWVKDGTESLHNREWQTFPYFPDFARWYDLLHVGKPLYGLVRDFPQSEQSLLTAWRTLSIIIVPIMIHDQFWGGIGFDARETERQWSEEEQSILLAMAGSIGGAIARQQAEEHLLAANSKLKKTLEHLQRTQAQLIVSEKMAALGQLVAGIAHELNTPIGAIRSSIHDIMAILDQTLKQLPTFIQTLPPSRQQDFWMLFNVAVQKDLRVSLKDERKLKRTLIKKLQDYEAPFALKIAEMLVNIGIYDHIEPYLDLLTSPEHSQILDMVYRLSGLHESTNTIVTAIERATKVIFALKTYSHYDHSEARVKVNIIDGIETVLTLYQNQIKHNVEIQRHYEELAPLWCYPDELNQVWTNLIHNALQAMKNKGLLTIEAVQRDTEVIVSVTDNGSGIPPEIRERIFEPFFTTKPAGEGSGLGLDIVKKIIDKHQGAIVVESRPGKTTFRVTLPM